MGFLALICLVALSFASHLQHAAARGTIGINYGRIANDLPPPPKVVELLKAEGVQRVKMYDTDESVLTAFANSGISLVVTLPNELLSSTAADPAFADKWVEANISKYHPATRIEAIAVGNEVFVDPQNTTQFLVGAMKNVHSSLVKRGLGDEIKVSSPVALSALGNSYPPSAGSFKPDLLEIAIKPMLEFLRETKSYMMINSYPFFAYIANSNTISLDYALFKPNPGNPDSGNGLKYMNLLDAQIDAVYAAMNALKYDDIKIVVSETGWPSAGDPKEIGATKENAAAYNGNLVRRALTGGGTPLKPKNDLDVYLFALFNENQKPGATSEKNYGLFYPDERKVYDIPLTGEHLKGTPTTPVEGSKTKVPPKSAGPAPAPSQTWCVASGDMPADRLQAALDWACGEGGADCKPIQPGAACHEPNTLEAHAAYAFNSYYQLKSRGAGTCDFGGTAHGGTQPPRYGSCDFPTGY